jgi:hypothetical protein
MFGFLDQMKQAKMQWVQDQKQNNLDNPNNVRREASRHFKNRKEAYLKAKFEELKLTGVQKILGTCIGTSMNLRRICQPRTNIVKDEKGDVVVDSRRILVGWKDYFSQLLHVHGFNDIRNTEIHTVELLVPEPSAFENELAIERLKSCISPVVDQIPGELL